MRTLSVKRRGDWYSLTLEANGITWSNNFYCGIMRREWIYLSHSPDSVISTRLSRNFPHLTLEEAKQFFTLCLVGNSLAKDMYNWESRIAEKNASGFLYEVKEITYRD